MPIETAFERHVAISGVGEVSLHEMRAAVPHTDTGSARRRPIPQAVYRFLARRFVY
jgi:hypothetical protein